MIAESKVSQGGSFRQYYDHGDPLNSGLYKRIVQCAETVSNGLDYFCIGILLIDCKIYNAAIDFLAATTSDTEARECRAVARSSYGMMIPPALIVEWSSAATVGETPSHSVSLLISQ